jgi:hypothetical protein
LPVKRLYLFGLILVICLLFVFSPLMQAKTYSPSNETDIIATSDKNQALQAMLGSFETYCSFLNNTEFKQGYYLPLHGRTRAEAIDYLRKGFEENLATAIVDEYTLFIPELDCLAIRPTDGLPLLNKDDIPYLGYNIIDNKHIIFSREFSGCYSLSDRYRYQVEMRRYQDYWKISALSLEEL